PALLPPHCGRLFASLNAPMTIRSIVFAADEYQETRPAPRTGPSFRWFVVPAGPKSACSAG
ncbi:MAG TPA: hypothetical protein VIH54_20120, partial [Chthoniobacterales bacterium]